MLLVFTGMVILVVQTVWVNHTRELLAQWMRLGMLGSISLYAISSSISATLLSNKFKMAKYLTSYRNLMHCSSCIHSFSWTPMLKLELSSWCIITLIIDAVNIWCWIQPFSSWLVYWKIFSFTSYFSYFWNFCWRAAGSTIIVCRVLFPSL